MPRLTEQEIDKAVEREFEPMMEKIRNFLTEFAEKQAEEARKADLEAKRKAKEYFGRKE